MESIRLPESGKQLLVYFISSIFLHGASSFSLSLLDKKLPWCENIIFGNYLFYFKPTGSLAIKFTSNHSTPLLELSTGAVFGLAVLFWYIVDFLAKYLIFGFFFSNENPAGQTYFNVKINIRFGLHVESNISTLNHYRIFDLKIRPAFRHASFNTLYINTAVCQAGI